jgi:hypothetical protein
MASAFLIPWVERSADRLPFVLRNTVSSSAKAPRTRRSGPDIPVTGADSAVWQDDRLA